MTETTIVRENLMTVPNYTPYCGNNTFQSSKRDCSNPRTIWNGEQFTCPECAFITQFPDDFIKRYKTKWNITNTK